jgi:hypothetical protein
MLNCHIAKDLLPAHIDGMLSEESEAELREHLQGCADCRAACERMKAPLEAAPPPEEIKRIDFLKKIRRGTVKKLAAGFAAFALFFIALAWIFAIGSPVKSEDLTLSPRIITGLPWVEEETNGVTTSVPQTYLDQTWSLEMELTNGKALIVSSEQLYEKDADGNSVFSGQILKPRQVPSSIVQSGDRFTWGYSATEPMDYKVIIRLKDRDIVYSMKDEGLFEEQKEQPANS